MNKRSTIQDLMDCNFAGKLSGARTSNRLSYQQAWSLMKLLKIHSSRKDYRAIFDYAEDFILYCNSSESPHEGEFYQIKTDDKKQSFSVNNLINQKTIRKKSDNSDVIKKSFLEKLFDNKKHFTKLNVKLFFVVNIPFQLTLVDPGVDCKSLLSLKLSDLHADELAKISKKLGMDYDLGTFSDTTFEVSILSLDQDERDQKLMVELANLIESKYPGKPYIISPILQAISAEVLRRSNFEKNPADVATFYAKKTISKENLENFINEGLALVNTRDKWGQEIQPLLLSEGMTYEELAELKVAYCSLSAMYIEDTLAIQEQVESIKKILSKVEKKGRSLRQLVDDCLVEYNKKKNNFSNPIDENVIRAMVLNEAI